MSKMTHKMTHKMFIHRARGRVSAVAFLKSHEEFLKTGSLKEKCEPILIQLFNEKLMPTTALNLIRDQVAIDLQENQIKVFESKLALKKEKENTISIKNQISQDTESDKEEKKKGYQVYLYDQDGKLIQKQVGDKLVNVTMSFDLNQRAEQWASLRLIGLGEGCYAEVVSNKLLDRYGQPMKTKIERRIAFANVHGSKKPGPMTKRIGKKNGSLTSRMKASGSRCNFSRG